MVSFWICGGHFQFWEFWVSGDGRWGRDGGDGAGPHPRGTVSTPKRRLESISQRRYDERYRAILVCGRVNLAGSVGPPSLPVTTDSRHD